MARDNEPSAFDEETYGSFVPAVFARSMAEAEVYCELLNDRDIPTVIGVGVAAGDEQDEKTPPLSDMSHGVPVLVPEALLDEAGIVIAEQESVDDYVGEDDEDEDDDEPEVGGSGFRELTDAEGDDELLDDEESPSDEEDR